jgi:hypothetical protein
MRYGEGHSASHFTLGAPPLLKDKMMHHYFNFQCLIILLSFIVM